jgi:hypothetical protein
MDVLLSTENYDDTLPTTDPKMAAQYAGLLKTLSQYRNAGINTPTLVQWRDQLASGVDTLASTQRMIGDVNETFAKNGRVETQSLVDLNNNTDDNLTKLATQSTQVISSRLSPALAAYQGAGNSIASGMESLTNTLRLTGVDPSRESPDIAGMMQEVSLRMFGKSLNQITPGQAAQMVRESSGGNETLAAETAALFRHGQSVLGAQQVTDRAIQETRRRLFELSQVSGGILSPEQSQEAVRLSEKLAGLVEARVGMNATDLRQEMERVAQIDSTYQGLTEEADWFKSLVQQPGQEGLRTKIARTMANEEFRQWAKDNGFRIGSANIDAEGNVYGYAPGPNDERAMLVFSHQMRTGRPVGFSRNSGQLVRVTVQDPAARERVLSEYNIGGGQYAVQDGVVLSPEDYAKARREQGIDPTGVQLAYSADNRTVFVKSGDTVTAYGQDGQLVQAAPPADLKFDDAIIYDGDKPARYATPLDLLDFDINMIGTPNEAERAALPKTLKGIDVVGADALPAIGEMSVVGYRDKINARDIIEGGPGTFSINGGQQKFGPGAKIEILESRGRTTSPTNALARRAERRAGGLGGLTPEETRRIEAPGVSTPAAPVAPVTPPAAPAAVDSPPFAPMAPPVAAPVPATPAPVATAPALPTFKDDGGYTFTKATDGTITVTGAPAGEKLPPKTVFKPTDAAYKAVESKLTQVEAPKPAVPTSDFYRMPDGSVFESLEGKGLRQVAPKRGDLTFDDAWKAEGSAAFSAATSRIEGEDVEELSKDEAMKFQRADLGAGLKAKPPEVEAREVRGSTVIDGGRVRNVGTDIRDTLEKMKQRREERQAERGVSPAVEEKKAAGKFSQTLFTKPLPSGDDIKDVAPKAPLSRTEATYAGMASMRDEVAMQALKQTKPGQPGYDLLKRYEAAQAVRTADPEKYFKEVLPGLAKEARRPPSAGVLTPGSPEEPTAPFEKRMAEKRAEIKADAAFMPPETTAEKQGRAALSARMESAEAAKQAKSFGEAARKAKYGEEEEELEFKPSEPEFETQASRSPLSTFRKLQATGARRLTTNTGVA